MKQITINYSSNNYISHILNEKVNKTNSIVGENID